MGKTFRVGIAGAGYVSYHHARALRDLSFVDVVGITDVDGARAGQLARKLGSARVYTNLNAMRAAAPDVIHVLTPPASHYSVAREALDMGCHVFIEKPMADTAAQCDELIDRSRMAGLTLSVNHSACFDPVVLRAAELVGQGVCGDILAVHVLRTSDYPRYAGGPLPAPYAQGSYPFRDLGVHGLSLIELFLGPTQAMEVRYYETGRDPLLTFDEWRVDVDCREGTGHIFLSWNARPIQNELRIHGTRGMLHVDCFLQTCEFHRVMPGPKEIGWVLQGSWNAVRKSFQVPWNMVRFATGQLKPSPGIYRGVHEFYRALEAGKPPPVRAEDARNLVDWIDRKSVPADREKQKRLERQAAGNPQPARVLVTGGGGFLGSALVDRLREQGEPVRLLLRRPPKRGAPADPQRDGGPLAIVYGSLGQPDVVDAAVAGVDTVYHVGATTQGSVEAFEEGTVQGTRNIVEACLRHNVKRLIYVSSMSVLDHAAPRTNTRVTEAWPLEPFPERRGAYTQTKLRAEQIVLEAARQRNLPAVVLRPGQIFGPGAEKVVPNGVLKIGGRWIVAGGGSRKLPLVYRDDVVDGLLAARQSEQGLGQTIHLVDSTPVDQNEYLRHCRAALGRTPVYRVPVFVLMIGAVFVEMLGKALHRSVPLSRYRVRSLKPLSPVDGSLAERLLHWKPTVGVHEGLRRTFGARAQTEPVLGVEAEGLGR